MSRSRLAQASALAAMLVGMAAAAQTAAPIYQSRFADAPPARVGQASRSGGANVQIVVLAPDRKGASATATPRLGWFLSADSTKPLEIVVQERGADVPLLEKRIESAGTGGYYTIDLAESKVQLLPGKEYEWSVALINDPARRASDQFSKGVVQYVPDSQAAPAGAPEAVVSAYLSRGFWYDAIAVMLKTLEEEPGRNGMVALRQQVLETEHLLAQR